MEKFSNYKVRMPKKGEEVYSRSWVITINNYTDDDVYQFKALVDKKPTFLVGGYEIAPSTGTPHIQGFVYWKDAKSFTTMTKLLTRAHLIPARGNDFQNDKYCGKDDQLVIRYGEPTVQGRRTDIDIVREQLKQGSNMRGIIDTAKSMQSIKMAEIYLKYNEEKRDWKPEVRWYHGSTGSGKTKTAREWLENDVYTCLDTIKWWEGYDKHENVLIDDFRKDWCKFHQLLKLLDRYEYKVETKGGSRQVLAKKIAITAPYHPADIYQTREDVNQLLRRIDQIILVGQPIMVPQASMVDHAIDLIDA